jgi:hypothetical protein
MGGHFSTSIHKLAREVVDPEISLVGPKGKIKSRLIADLDPEEWELPPKPKWMRWKTYNRHEEKFDHYEAILDYGCAALAAKLTGLKTV